MPAKKEIPYGIDPRAFALWCDGFVDHLPPEATLQAALLSQPCDKNYVR